MTRAEPASVMMDAFHQGYATGEKGDPANFNPHPSGPDVLGLDKHWHDGWEAARDDAEARRARLHQVQNG